MVVNEEGKIEDLPHNFTIYKPSHQSGSDKMIDSIEGSAILTGIDVEGDIGSLNINQIERIENAWDELQSKLNIAKL
jgi:hypothetical protein